MAEVTRRYEIYKVLNQGELNHLVATATTPEGLAEVIRVLATYADVGQVVFVVSITPTEVIDSA